ncbi:NADH:ubiquinone reductase (Na(+)-transporting) subunit F [PVC group bacterium]|nr:NADH:ubiquinone reductase (Na(+)-transporting) subunit F [PVC group bacterium]
MLLHLVRAVYVGSTTKTHLVTSGNVRLGINHDESLAKQVPAGGTLLERLSALGIFLPSACGGGGTCALCKCQVFEGGGDILPTETGHISRKEAKDNWRLSCQVKVRQDMELGIPDEIFNIKKYTCTVKSNPNVASFIKELNLDLDNNEILHFKNGGYIQIDIPKYDDMPFKDFQIEDEYRPDWDKYNIWEYHGKNTEETYRAFSMANHPAEGNRIMLNVRIATPPPKTDFPPGIASTYMFNLKKGDKVTVSGPFGEFFIKDTDREMVFIGGGAGMAPMRSHIFHLFYTEKTKRKATFFYGARSKKEMFYDDEFKEIEKNNPNFKYMVALSEPKPEDNWDGPVGFIHQVVFDTYLKDHEEPDEIEYYLCGPPMMLRAIEKMLADIGVEQEMIAFDEFG